MGVDSWLFVFSVIDEGALLFLVVYFVSFYDIICSSMSTLLNDSDRVRFKTQSRDKTQTHAAMSMATTMTLHFHLFHQ